MSALYRNGFIDRLITRREWNRDEPGPFGRLRKRVRYLVCQERFEWLWWNPIIKCNHRFWPLKRSLRIARISINGVEHPNYLLDPNRFYTVFGWGVAGGFELEWLTRADGSQSPSAVRGTKGRGAMPGRRWGRIKVQYK